MSWFQNPLKYWGLTSALAILCLTFVSSVSADDIEIDLGATPTIATQSKTSLQLSKSDNESKESTSANEDNSTVGSSDSSQSSINKIDVSSSASGDLVSIDGSVLSEPSVEKISNKKLLVKFENTTLSVGKRLNFNNDFVKSIRSAAHEKAAWVVLDVTKVRNWKVNKTALGYVLALKTDKTTQDLAQVAPATESKHPLNL